MTSDRKDNGTQVPEGGGQKNKASVAPPRRRVSTHHPKGKRKQASFSKTFWIVILLGVLGGAGYWGYLNFLPQGEELGDFVTDYVPVVEQAAAGDRAVVVVFPEWDATGYVTEERQIPSRDRPGEDLLGLIQALCLGPQISGAVSAIPNGTTTKGAFYNADNHAVVLDFSQELVTGHPGGSTAEAATLTSILRTVALNFPETRSCIILVAGAQVETLSGHLKMDQPFDPRRWL